jgi:cytochrome c oxidase assembly protein subunit 15
MSALSLPVGERVQKVAAAQLSGSLQLVRVAVYLALLVVLLGGWTRLKGAGLSCPDWPGCYGALILPSSDEAVAVAQLHYPQHPLDLSLSWIEMSHRYLAGSLGLVVAALALIGWRQRARPDYPLLLSGLLLGLVILQALFGMWTVTLKLLPQIVTLHLLGGLLTLTLLLRLQQRLRLIDAFRPAVDRSSLGRTARRGLGRGVGIGAGIGMGILLLLIQIGLGGWTSSNYAGWSCSHWLDCEPNQSLVLDFDAGFSLAPLDGRNYQGGQLPRAARAAIQMSHRAAGVLLTGYLLGLSILLFRRSALRRATGVLLLLLALQLLLGGLNVHFGLPLGLAFAHHLGAVALLLALMHLYGHRGIIEETKYE